MEATRLRFISGVFFCIFIGSYFGNVRPERNGYGKPIGNFSKSSHQVRGEAYAVDDSTIFIKNFSYDGTSTTAYFWVGNSTPPSPSGILVPYPDTYRRDPPALRRYDNENIILKLPLGIKIRDITYLSVWCLRFTVSFGIIYIPPNLETPKTRVLPEFSRLAHGLRSGNISILDSKTVYIPNLHYDGAGPDAYFWVGTGSEPNPLGTKVPSETNSLEPLRGYQGEDIELVLPKNLTVYDIDWLAVWCIRYKHNFGHVMIPKDLEVPPALGQTQITTSSATPPLVEYDLSNCKEMLEGRVQVQWQFVGEDVKIRISARIDEDQYVAFGLSGKEGRSEMVGGDVVVVAFDQKSRTFFAEDYYISSLSQCDGKRGVCPDERVGGKNDAVFIDGKRKDGITTVIYTRPLRTNEPEKDKIIPEDYTSVIAAIGVLNSKGEANAHHSSDMTKEDIRINFASKNSHQCTNSLYDLPDRPKDFEPWVTREIYELDEPISVRIGPTGGKKGYSYITGQPSWGIAWYLNDLLIPEITVERGRNYTFIVEGGNDTTNPAKYHPFYITDSPEGGFGQRNETQRRQQKVFAGVDYDGNGYAYPTAAGRYCEWTHKSIDQNAESKTFEDFFETLKLDCERGEPATLVWSVAEDTPDLVYYQCYTHINLGWKIHVVEKGHKRNADGAVEPPSRKMIFITALVGYYGFFYSR